MLKRILAGLIVAVAMAGAAVAENLALSRNDLWLPVASRQEAETNRHEFLFTQDRVVSLTLPNAFVSFKTKFDQAALREALKGYGVRRIGQIEDSDAFEVTRNGAVFLHVMGDLSSGTIAYVWDVSGASDASGAVAGDPITRALNSGSADCSDGLAYYCWSEHSPAVSYIVGWTEACPVDFHEYPERTELLECMTIDGFEWAPRANDATAVSSVATAENLALSGDDRWVAVASRQDPNEAISIARTYSAWKPRVVRAQNGWFAVVLGPYATSDIASFRRDYSGPALPPDAMLTRGTGYVETVWPSIVVSQDYVRAFVQVSLHPNARQQAVETKMSALVSLLEMVKSGLIRSVYDCPPELRIVCLDAIESSDSSRSDDFIIQEWGEWDSFDEARMREMIAQLVSEAASRGFSLLTDDELTEYSTTVRPPPNEQPTSGNQTAQAAKDHLCALALNDARDGWEDGSRWAVDVAEAKQRNLSIDDCRVAIGLPRLPTPLVAGPAKDLCGLALNGAKEDWDARSRYADDVAEAKRRNLSIDDCRLAIGLPKISEPDSRSAWAACEKPENADASIAACTSIIGERTANETHPYAYGNRGVAHLNKGDYDQAIADFDEAIRLNPDYVWAYYHRGVAYKNSGNPNRAIVDFDRAIQLTPDLALAYFNRGDAYDAKGDEAKALDDFRIAAQQLPASDPDYDRAVKRIAEIEAKIAAAPGHSRAPTSPPQPGAVNPDTEAAQKAILYEEPLNAAAAQSGVVAVNAVVTWNFAQGSEGPEIVGNLDVPERSMKIKFTIRRNTDNTLPASHMIEVIIDVPASFPGKGIRDVPRLVLKPSEEVRGEPLIGASAKAADGLFWIALSGFDTDVATNLALMKERNWIDLPLVYENGQRAILTFEKGAPGERVFEQAMTAWAAAKPAPPSQPPAPDRTPSPPPPASPPTIVETPEPPATGSGAAVKVETANEDGRETTIISIDGELVFGDEKRFVDAAIGVADAVVMLSSPGGNLFAGIEIGKAIRLKGFSTVVPEGFQCASACALAWLAGSPRFMGKGATVGFHAAFATDNGRDTVSSGANAIVGAYLSQLGLPTSAILYIAEPQPDEIRWLTFDDAERIGIEVRRFSPG